MSNKSRRTSNTSVTDFENFFQGWLVRQEHYRDHLRTTIRNIETCTNEELRDLTARVLAHYQQYYEEKSRIANHDVSLVFSPPWFSYFEQSFFWLAGFKPGLTFRIVRTAVDDMSDEQVERMDRLRAETKEEERRLENEMARIQESVAAPPIVEVTRRGENSLVDWRYDEMESAVEVLRAEMEVVVGNADLLRTRTAERVVEIFTPVQNVKFLAAVTELQLKIRIWGVAG
ncbi:protein ZW2-like [Bidens hawaiensis]|uniref:protein ZW2-like n=1 Tax=Bidens hawaiensis TaxID=980011 RepID=UPI004049C835